MVGLYLKWVTFSQLQNECVAVFPAEYRGIAALKTNEGGLFV